MPSAREVRLRIRSVKNIAQVTRAMQAVSASKVRKAQLAVLNTRPYARKAWQVLRHIAAQPGHENLHPLLKDRERINNVLVVLVTGDRGLAGAYTTNIIRFALKSFGRYQVPVQYVTVGRKGRDLMLRRRQHIVAEFSSLPAAPSFADVSAIGRVAVEEFLAGKVDEVYLLYTDFISLARQVPTIKRLLPLEVAPEDLTGPLGDGSRPSAAQANGRADGRANGRNGRPPAAYIYEPGQAEILDEIIPRYTALQVYEAILESLASEHAARMVAMKNATESAKALADALQLEYNKARQQAITGEILDIVGGSEAQEG